MKKNFSWLGQVEHRASILESRDYVQLGLSGLINRDTACTPPRHHQVPFQTLWCFLSLQRMGLQNKGEKQKDSTTLCGNPLCRRSGEKQMFLKYLEREKSSWAWFSGDQLALVGDGGSNSGQQGRTKEDRQSPGSNIWQPHPLSALWLLGGNQSKNTPTGGYLGYSPGSSLDWLEEFQNKFGLPVRK